jgi:outer membrane protein TolC
MSPLGIVAAFGLMVGIFGSVWIYPVIYSLFDSAAEKLKGHTPKNSATATLILLLTGLSVTSINAAETNQIITLDKAIEYAHQHSPLLLASQADAMVQHGIATTAKSSLLPKVGLTGNLLYSPNSFPIRFGAPPENIRFSDTTYSFSLDATQLLLDFGRTRSRLEAAHKQAAASDEMVNRVRNEITFRITALYHKRLMMDDLLAASIATEKSLNNLVENIKERLKVGKAARLELLKVQVKLADVKSRLATLEAEQINTQSSLSAAMGYKGPPLICTTNNIILLEKPIENQTVKEWIKIAYQQRADLHAREQLVEAGLAEEKSAHRSRWPTISALGSYGQYGGNDPFPGNSIGGNQDSGWEDNYFIGAKLNLPILDFGLRSGQIASAEAKRIKAEALQTEIYLQIEREVRTAVAELNSTTVRTTAFKESVVTAKQALHDEEQKYEMGKSTINDLLDAEAAKLVAYSQYSLAIHEQQIAIINLKLATGTLSATNEAPGE